MSVQKEPCVGSEKALKPCLMHILTLLKRLDESLLELGHLCLERLDFFPAIQWLVAVGQVTLFDTLSGTLDTLALLVSLLLHALDLFPDLVNVSAEHLGAHAGLFSVEVLLFEGGGDGLEDVCLLGAEMGGLCGEAAADDVVGVGGGGGGFMGGGEAGDEGGGELDRGVWFLGLDELVLSRLG